MSDRTQVSLNGTFDDVAAFFRVSIRTVVEWKSAQPPIIGHTQLGRKVCFSEEDVIEAWVRNHAETRGLSEHEARERARRQWREHLKIRGDAGAMRAQLEQLKERVEKLDGRILSLETKTEVLA